MAKLIIDIKRTHRKREPINIEIVKIGNDFKIDEALLYALQAVIDEENERKELIRGAKKNVQQKNYRYR